MSYKSHVSARLCELRDMGCVQELGERPCGVTGHNVILWDVTDTLSNKLDKELRPTRKELETRLRRADLFFRMAQAVFGTDPKWIKLLQDFRGKHH